jgi:hypothetical protein
MARRAPPELETRNPKLLLLFVWGGRKIRRVDNLSAEVAHGAS